jgi:ParB-like chromosome segregation protein Spo0J
VRYLETRDVPIASLTPYPGNARVHDRAALDESVEVNGQYRAIVARRIPDGGLQILAGHGTTAAFARRGDDTVRVEVIEADDEEALRVVLADNRISDKAEYDHTALLALLDEAQADGGLAGTGWDGDAYDDLVKLLEAPDLDKLAKDVGEPTDEDRRVVFRVALDPDVKARLEHLMALTGEPEEADAVAGVVAWASDSARADGLDVEP